MFKRMALVNLSHLLPMPAPHRRLFSQDAQGELVDMGDAYWRAAEVDGSIHEVPEAPAVDKPEADKPDLVEPAAPVEHVEPAPAAPEAPLVEPGAPFVPHA